MKDSSTLPAELQRLLNTIRELDDRSQGSFLPFLFYCTNARCSSYVVFSAEVEILIYVMWYMFATLHTAMINQTRQQTKYCLGLASQGGAFSRKNEEEEVSEKFRKEIEANQDNALSLCTEKVLLARQAHDLVSQ